MFHFFVALLLFLGSHLVSSVPQFRSFFIKLLSERCYLIIYSILSMITLWWLFHTAIKASTDFILWPKFYWAYWIPNVTMPFVCILISLGINTPNSLSILCKRRFFDPEQPKGIVAITRHPILWAMFLWSLSHIFPNGSLSLVIVFSVFALFSLFGMKLVDFRLQKSLGKAHWDSLSKNTSILPFYGQIRSHKHMNWTQDDWYSVIIGLGIYYLFLNLHEYVIGVHPLQFRL